MSILLSVAYWKGDGVINKAHHQELLIIGIALLGIIAVFVFLQPKFRLFDNKTENNDIATATTTVVQTDNESQPQEVDNDKSVDMDAARELTSPQGTPSKPKPQDRAIGSRLELPITLPLPVLPSCDETKRNEYEATYLQNVEAENAFHDSEVNRILGLGLLDELLSETLDQETARHQNALTDLKTNLDDLLRAIACLSV